MNRLFTSFVLCFGVLAATACGSTAAAGGGGTADSQGGNDTGLPGDGTATADTTAADTGAADTAKGDAAMPMDTMAMDTMAMDTMAMDTGMMDTGMMDTGPKDTGPADTGPSVDAAASGACTNSADKTILDAGKVQDQATTCALQNMGNPTKASDCVKTTTGLSDGCSVCFAGIMSCTMTNCISQCMAGASAPACVQCMADKGCTSTFATCAGVSP